jgi:histone acetyltransferase (RNA polymerase elongator complex component)
MMRGSIPYREDPSGPLSDNRRLVIPIFLPHSGCPCRCVFCDQTAISAQPCALPSLEEISSQVETFLAHSRHPRHQVQIAFYGGNFLGLDRDVMTHFLDHGAFHVRAGRVDSLRFSTRPDTVDAARLELLSSYPVATIELGVQSMDDAVLAASRRGHTAKDSEAAVELLKKGGYRIGLQLMVGLPGDTPASLMATALKVKALKPDFVRIYPTLVLAQSPLAKWYETGRYLPLSLETAVELVKPIYALFSSCGIRVVRMGLQDSHELNDKSVVLAGPHHPAFGHLVLSAICLDRLRELILAFDPLPRQIRVRVHPKNISRLQGLKKSHLTTLCKEFHLSKVSLAADCSLDPNAVMINDGPLHCLFPWLPIG